MERKIVNSDLGSGDFNEFSLPRRDAQEVREMPFPDVFCSREAAIGAKAAALAGPLIREGYRTTSGREAKAAGDFVTATDTAAERAIIEYLRRETPEIPIISEESSPSGELPSGRAWIVDPLDGTSAFIFKSDPSHPAVMVALMENGRPITSTVYLPLVDRWFVAERGEGAWMFEDSPWGKWAVFMSADESPQTIKGSHIVMNHYGDSRFETSFFREASLRLRGANGAGLVTVEPPNSAVSCRMMEPRSPVVAVIHDNNPAKVKQEVWDIAPILLFVEESGGYVSDQFGNPYTIGTGAPLVITRNAEVYRELFGLIGAR